MLEDVRGCFASKQLGPRASAADIFVVGWDLGLLLTIGLSVVTIPGSTIELQLSMGPHDSGEVCLHSTAVVKSTEGGVEFNATQTPAMTHGDPAIATIQCTTK